MPLLPIFFLLLLPVMFVLAMPFSLVQRYRVGTARRLGRRWVAGLNLLLIIFSTVVFFCAAALTNLWVPHAFAYSLRGVLVGAAVGVCALALTRWEETARGLHYTPPRGLVLVITVVVAARIVYGIARAWHAWSARHETAWLEASGLAASLGVGAGVLGYYLVYSAGVWRRIRRFRAGAFAPGASRG